MLTYFILDNWNNLHWFHLSKFLLQHTYLPSPSCNRKHKGQCLELFILLYPELSSLFLPRLSPFPLALPPQLASKLSLGDLSFFSLLGSILKILSQCHSLVFLRRDQSIASGISSILFSCLLILSSHVDFG